MPRRMNGVFTNSLFLAIGQCLLPFQFCTFLALVLPFPRLCLQGRAYLLGKCCKVHSVTKQTWLHITVGNITYVKAFVVNVATVLRVAWNIA